MLLLRQAYINSWAGLDVCFSFQMCYRFFPSSGPGNSKNGLVGHRDMTLRGETIGGVSFCPDRESLLTVVTRLSKWSISRGGGLRQLRRTDGNDSWMTTPGGYSSVSFPQAPPPAPYHYTSMNFYTQGPHTTLLTLSPLTSTSL